MNWKLAIILTVLFLRGNVLDAKELEIKHQGALFVGTTNLEVDNQYENVGDQVMHQYLLGIPTSDENPIYLNDILKHPESAWLVEVKVPDFPKLYGPTSNQLLPIVSFIAYPSASVNTPREYRFPYHNNAYGVFANMLAPNESPVFAHPNKRYPLIILAHGSSAHGIYDVRHAHNLASQGYIVAVIFYTDDRTLNRSSHNRGFLRPLITKQVINSLLKSKSFGANIDHNNIGVSGHSFGGFTALALAGAKVQGHKDAVTDPRVTAAVIAAPWVGGKFGKHEVLAFGSKNNSLKNINIPVLSLHGSKDTVTVESYILAAARKYSGPRYVVELVDQPHIFEGGSWQDRDKWESLFFSAYLQHDAKALALIKKTVSMKGGNIDRQLFEYQQ